MSTDGSAPRWASQPAAQREGIEAGPLIAFLIGTLLVLGGGVFGSTLWLQREADAARAVAAANARYPELQQAEMNARSKLGHYRIISQADGVFQIPIERAMEVLAQESGTDSVLTSELRY